VPILGL